MHSGTVPGYGVYCALNEAMTKKKNEVSKWTSLGTTELSVGIH